MGVEIYQTYEMKYTLNTFQTYIDDFNIKLSENSDN